MNKKINNQNTFKPKIICFACNWSAYAILKKEKFRLSANIHCIRVICLGRINPSFIFRAFEFGADGVLLLGCSPEECRYNFSKKLVEEHYNIAKNVIHLLGIEKERLSVLSFSVGEDALFVKRVNRFVKRVKNIGPSPLK